MAHPWLVVARVAGWAAFPLAAMGWMVFLFSGTQRPPISTGQHVAAWSFAIAGMLFVPLLVLRRSLLAGAIARERARLAVFDATGWFEAFGAAWSEGRTYHRDYGSIEMFVGLAAFPSIDKLQAAVAALVRDTVVVEAAGGIVIRSVVFGDPRTAYGWANTLLRRFLPPVHGEYPIQRIALKRREPTG